MYPRGFLKVTVAVSHNFTESEPAFTVDFSIRIIDCSVSEDYFEFSVGDNVVCAPNKPPLVQDQVTQITVYANSKKLANVGLPFDGENDEFTLTEWGFIDLLPGEPKPEWIKLKSNSTEDGVIFEINPRAEDA